MTTHKPLMIVGECWGEHEQRTGRPFSGPSGSVLMSMLRQAGISKQDVHMTNVFNFRPYGGRIENIYTSKKDGIPNYRPVTNGKYVHKKYQPELDRLGEEISITQPNLILACGNIALWALCKKSGIKRYRGSPLLDHTQNYKVLPTWHPASILRQWELRPIALADIYKAKDEMTFSDLRRPTRYIYINPENLDELWEFYHNYLKGEPFISCDIETKGGQITEVGFGTSDGKRALVVPFYSRKHKDGNYWPDLETELLVWGFVRHICKKHKLVGQNFAYDMQYLWRTVGIPCPHFLGDTMILHHSMQPELEKGLGFLGSVYTREPSWKFMRQDHSDHLKKGDD